MKSTNEELTRKTHELEDKISDFSTREQELATQNQELAKLLQEQTSLNEGLIEESRTLNDRIAGFHHLEKKMMKQHQLDEKVKAEYQTDEKETKAQHQRQVERLEKELETYRTSNELLFGTLDTAVKDSCQRESDLKSRHEDQLKHLLARNEELEGAVAELQQSAGVDKDRSARNDAALASFKGLLAVTQEDLSRVSWEAQELKQENETLKRERDIVARRQKPSFTEVWVFDTPPPSSARKYLVQEGVVKDEKGEMVCELELNPVVQDTTNSTSSMDGRPLTSKHSSRPPGKENTNPASFASPDPDRVTPSTHSISPPPISPLSPNTTSNPKADTRANSSAQGATSDKSKLGTKRPFEDELHRRQRSPPKGPSRERQKGSHKRYRSRGCGDSYRPGRAD